MSRNTQVAVLCMSAVSLGTLVAGCGSGTAKPPTTAVAWSQMAAPVASTILGGPVTLTQIGQGNPSVTGTPPILDGSGTPAGANVNWNYCTGSAITQNNGTVSMAPYYQPWVVAQGNTLQGFFDYRVKDTNEAIVAANSTDGGKSWVWQGTAFNLTQACPADATKTFGTDDGYGHPYTMSVGGVSRLYLLDRSTTPVAAIDNLGLVYFPLAGGSNPLAGMSPVSAKATSVNGDYQPFVPNRTMVLINPDGFVAVIPGTNPQMVLYSSKLLKGDNTGATALPAAMQCPSSPYAPIGSPAGTKAKSANHDITNIRLASTTDGINFTDLGLTSGLNDPTAIAWSATRYIAPGGSAIKLANGRYGLFFAGGNCLDGDSDGFHYIGYAESPDLKRWTVINDINSPIASVKTQTFTDSNNTSVTIPGKPPVIGEALPWFAARIYGPQAIVMADGNLSLTFSGYGGQSPNYNLLNYRQIGNVRLSSQNPLPTQP